MGANYWSGKRVLITGITGFAGSYLAESLLSKGAIVFGFDRSAVTDNLTDILTMIDLQRAELSKPSQLKKIVQNSDPSVVFHLAAQPSVSRSFEKPLETYEANFVGTANLLEALRKHSKMESFVFVSSADVYGAVKESENPISERLPIRPVSPYAASKAAAEQLCIFYGANYGIHTAITRAFPHIGVRNKPWQVVPSIVKQVAECLRGGKKEIMLGNLGVVRDFTDVHDMMEGYLLAAERGKNGEPYNFGSGIGRSIREVAETAIRVAGLEGEMELKTDPSLCRLTDLPVHVCDNTKAKRDLGWSPKIKFEDTLREMIAYYSKKRIC